MCLFFLQSLLVSDDPLGIQSVIKFKVFFINPVYPVSGIRIADTQLPASYKIHGRT